LRKNQIFSNVSLDSFHLKNYTWFWKTCVPDRDLEQKKSKDFWSEEEKF
jgi:hypothetical protein